MKSFALVAIFACISTVACFGGGCSSYGGSQQGQFAQQQQQQQQQASASSYKSESSVSKAASGYAGGASEAVVAGGGYGTSGYGYGSGGYGGAGYGGAAYGSSVYDASAASQQQVAASSYKSESSVSKAASGYAGGASEAVVAGSGYGATGYGYGSGGYGGAAYGGAAYGASSQAALSQQQQQQSSYSKSSSFSRSAASSAYAGSSASSSSLLYETYPQLGRVPFFESIYNLASAEKSVTCARSIISEGFDYERTFESLFSANSYFKQYFWASTGITIESEVQRQKFFSLVKSNPGSIIRTIRNFARHGRVFNSNFGQLLVQQSSAYLLDNYSSYTSYIQQESWGLNYLFQSNYYRQKIATFLGLRSYEINAVRSGLYSAFQSNFGSTLVALKHVLLRKQLFSYNDYLSIKSSSVYTSQFRSRLGYVAPYYSQFYGASGASASSAYAAQSSYAKSTSYSKSVSSSSSSSSSAAAYGASSAYSLSEYYPQLAGIPFFNSVYNLASTEKSATCGSIISSGFDFESTFSKLFSANSYFSSYFWGATGISVTSAAERSRFFSLVKSNPGSIIRTIRHFAKHGYLYNSSFGQLLIQQNSEFLLDNYSRYTSYLSQESWGLSTIFRSTYYRQKLATFFGLQSFEESVIKSRLYSSFQSNFGGTLLALRHLLLRKQLSSYQSYLSIKSSSIYASQFRSQLSYRSSYYSQYYSQQQSSFSRQQSRSYSSTSSASSANSAYSAAQSAGGYSAGGYSGGGYSSGGYAY